jgi:hypothetical protein
MTDNDPSWGEAVAAFDTATPALLGRCPSRTLVIDLAWDGNEWTATSTDLEGFKVRGTDREWVVLYSRASLRGWLDPAVKVKFRDTS